MFSKVDGEMVGSSFSDVGAVIYDVHRAAAVDGGGHIAGFGAGHVGVGAAGVLLQGVSATLPSSWLG